MHTNWNWKELAELQERIGRLTPAEQLHLIERIAAGIRDRQFTDHTAIERAMDEMVNDPGFQRVLRNEDLKDMHEAG